jgi:hypothetical protein
MHEENPKQNPKRNPKQKQKQKQNPKQKHTSSNDMGNPKQRSSNDTFVTCQKDLHFICQNGNR